MTKQIIFVDSSVQNYQSLIKDADAAQIVILNDNLSGIEQITNALANQKDFTAVHILSHGSEGSVKLGSDVLNENDLAEFQTQIKQWGNAITENGDILLYGCDVAEGETGKNFVKQLSEITQSDVAASNNLTGNAAKGGDWDLEIATGKIEAAVPFNREAMKDYDYVLADFPVTVATDDGTGGTANTLSWAIRQANVAAGNDTITLNTNVTVTGVMLTLINSNIDFIGNNNNISGGNAFRPLFVKQGTVNFSNLTITNGLAKGGDSKFGGMGAGMGGALFIYNGTVGLNNVTFSNNRALGGSLTGGYYGSDSGGGGMGGNGVIGGGGGLFASASGVSGGYGGNGNYGGGVGAFGGGGNSGSTGGFGGGGGAGNIPGGFGGGGGDGSAGALANGGYGGGGGNFGISGNFGGGGNTYGGGGAGLGGALFIRQGSLTLNNATFSTNNATGGTSQATGQAKGGAIFAMTSLTQTNGNNQGMPTALPIVTSSGAIFTGNTAANQASTPGANTPANGLGLSQDNNDVYGNINTAPVLADTVVILNPVLEDSLAPTGAVGTLISAIAAMGTGQNNVTDPDIGAVAGLAITAADTTNGSWLYTINGGTTWNPLGTVSDTSARLLAADGNTRIYFQPSPNYSGIVANGITFRAWDQITGTNGSTADTSINGGFTAYSTATDTAAITVDDNDIAYAITVDTPAFAEGNTGTQTRTYTINRTGATTVASAVDYAITGGTADSTDYNNIGGTSGATGTTGTINFAANETSKTITLGVLGDTTIENDETIIVTLVNPTAATGYAATITAPTNATTTISNDDQPSVNFGAATYNTTEDTTATTVTIPVTLSAVPLANVTVPIVVNASSSATGADYTLSTTSITFLANTTTLTQDIVATINPDDIPENAETITLDFGTITGGTAGTITPSTTVTIAANDPISYAIATSAATLTEGNSSSQPVTFTVTRSGGIGVASTVNYALSGTADSSDYNNIGGTSGATTATGTINFAATETSKTITLDVLGDALVEPDETIIATLSNPTLTPAPESSTITTATATTTINNDDAAPEIQVLDGTTDIADGTTSAIDFGSGLIGATLNKTFTVKNLGTAALNLSNLTLPTGFSPIGNLPASVAAGGSTTFQVQVDTTAVGNKTGTLQFVNDDSDENPFDFSISATVTATAAPEIQVLDGTTDIADGTASAIDFGSGLIGGTLNKTFTVKNLGTAALNLSNLTLPTGFSPVGNLPPTVAAGASTTFQVQVDTATAGNKSGKLEFVNDDSDENPFDFPISASVTVAPAPEIQVLDNTTDIVDGTISAIDFGSGLIGGTLNKTFTVKNLGTA
ncbi:DUF4347 domain-containing protein, partial [Microcoleus sp. A2-D3]